jgi:hypothetical protein
MNKKSRLLLALLDFPFFDALYCEKWAKITNRFWCIKIRVGVVKTTWYLPDWFLPPNKSQKWEILENSIL